MSGSGGGFGGGSGGSDSCEDLVINTQISSPRAAVIQGIAVNDVLSVDVMQQGAVTVVVVKRGVVVAGGIAAPEVQRLRACIERGTDYIARVTRINGAQISIRISVRP